MRRLLRGAILRCFILHVVTEREEIVKKKVVDLFFRGLKTSSGGNRLMDIEAWKRKLEGGELEEWCPGVECDACGSSFEVRVIRVRRRRGELHTTKVRTDLFCQKVIGCDSEVAIILVCRQPEFFVDLFTERSQSGLVHGGVIEVPSHLISHSLNSTTPRPVEAGIAARSRTLLLSTPVLVCAVRRLLTLTSTSTMSGQTCSGITSVLPTCLRNSCTSNGGPSCTTPTCIFFVGNVAATDAYAATWKTRSSNSSSCVHGVSGDSDNICRTPNIDARYHTAMTSAPELPTLSNTLLSILPHSPGLRVWKSRNNCNTFRRSAGSTAATESSDPLQNSGTPGARIRPVWAWSPKEKG